MQEFQHRWQVRSGLTADEYRARGAAIDLPAIDIRAGTADGYWEEVGNALGMSTATVERMRAEMWDEYCGSPNDELMEYAISLQSRVGLAILSNSVDGAREEE